MTELERFFEKVDRSGGEDACWLWTASIHADGYGRFSQKLPDGRWQMVPAHRAALILHGVTPITGKLDACHRPTCPRHCVNPRHLRFDTHAANMGERSRGVGTKNRLTEEQKIEIIRRVAAGATVTHLAAEFGVTRQNIHYLVRRRTEVTLSTHNVANDNDGVQTGEVA